MRTSKKIKNRRQIKIMLEFNGTWRKLSSIWNNSQRANCFGYSRPRLINPPRFQALVDLISGGFYNQRRKRDLKITENLLGLLYNTKID